MNKLTKNEIVNSFSKKDIKKLKLPDLDNIDWENIDYLGWIHRSRHIGYIVYLLNKKLIGIFLNITKTKQDNKYKQCSLCMTQHTGAGISLFTKADRNHNSKGNYICANLDCGLYLRNKKDILAIQMQENITKEQKLERYLKNLKQFINDILG